MKKIKILQVLPSFSLANGVAAYIDNYFENMDKNNIEMHFLIYMKDDEGREKNIIKNGGVIKKIYFSKNIFKHISTLQKYLKEEKFDIVHCHAANYGAIFLFIAKINRIKTRILHSHVNKNAETKIKEVRNNILTFLALKSANEYFSCTQDAGKFMFKKRKFTVIKNAIDSKKYQYNPEIREKIRNDLQLNNKFVIGEFGRFCYQKNQLFALDILKEIVKINSKTILLLIGSGDLKNKIIAKAEKENLTENIIILDSKKDIHNYYNCLDAFLLPSTYEGLGIVLIEAQANGLKCFTSEKLVPNEVNITNLVEFIELNNNAEIWAEKIVNSNFDRYKITDEIQKNGYEIKQESNVLYSNYITLYEKGAR